ncbi:MAG: hypothetical protein WC551_09295 [Patescibacteria group bacterium]
MTTFHQSTLSILLMQDWYFYFVVVMLGISILALAFTIWCAITAHRKGERWFW